MEIARLITMEEAAQRLRILPPSNGGGRGFRAQRLGRRGGGNMSFQSSMARSLTQNAELLHPAPTPPRGRPGLPAGGAGAASAFAWPLDEAAGPGYDRARSGRR